MREFWQQRGLHRDPHAEADGLGQRVRRRAVQGRVLRKAGLPRAVAAVLQADGDGGGLRQGVRGRAGVPREPVVHLTPRHRVHERRRGDLLDRLPRGRDGLRGGWLAHVLGRGEGGSRRGDRRDLRHRADRAGAALPARDARAGQGAAARGGPRRPAGTGARPRPAVRARAVRADQGERRPRVRVRDRLPDDGAALLPHAPPRRSDSDAELRPAVAGHRADDGRPARAPLRAAAGAGAPTRASRRVRSSTTSTSSATARRPTAASASA